MATVQKLSAKDLICWGRSTCCFVYSFLIQLISEKTLSSKGFTSNLRDNLYENTVLNIVFKLF